MKFSVRSALAIIAVYGVMFAVMRSLGTLGILAALIPATALSGIIVLARRNNIGAIVRVAVGCLIGTFFGFGCLSDLILYKIFSYDHGFGESEKSLVIGGVLGAILGAVVASMFTRSRSSSRNQWRPTVGAPDDRSRP